MTPAKVRILTYIAQCGILTTGQVARIAGIGQESAYKHLRHLFDMGMLERIAVPYANLVPGAVLEPNHAFGPGPNIHYASRAALHYLERAERISEELANRKLPDYGVNNSLFLPHELLVRDVRVWLELCTRLGDGHVERWVDGTAAHIPPARPDGWFVYHLEPGGALVGLVEADRGTERGDQWERKAVGYEQMRNAGALKDATGWSRGRLAVVALTEARRDAIAQILSAFSVADISYVTTVDDLSEGGLARPVWRYAGTGQLVSLIQKVS